MEEVMRNQALLSLILLLLPPLAGYWAWLRFENLTPMLGVLALASAAVAGALWYLRLQAQRRWRMALDAYAERALARHTSQKRLKAPAVPGLPRGLAMAARH
jgi:hypothetical protein